MGRTDGQTDGVQHLPDKPPHVGVGGQWTSVRAICCSTETDRSTVPPEDVWLSGVFGGKSVSLECITGQSERSIELTLDIFRRHLKTYFFMLY